MRAVYMCAYWVNLLPLRATTHSDLILRAHKEGIGYRVIHNASILNAVGACGLQVCML